jgi:hypothetical protein
MTVKLICFEPWRGKFITKYDSGFGDRMRFWELAHYLSTIIDDMEIIVEEKYWPELLLLDFPNTTSENISSLRLSENQLIPISYQEVKNIIITKKSELLNSSGDNYYYFNFLMPDIPNNIFYGTNIPYDLAIHNAVSKIKLKIPEASDYMQQQFSDYCCIHLRRGNGTFPTLKFLSEIRQFLPSEVVRSYWNQFHRSRIGNSIKSREYKYFDSMIERDTDTEDKNLSYIQTIQGKSAETVLRDFTWVNEYKIIPDSDYFNLIVNFILKENPDQKIHISSDIPKQYYSHYYDNFPHNIVDKTFHFEMFLKFYEGKLDSEKLRKKYSIPIDKVFENVFDLMVGFHSKIIVKRISNWSEICSLYKKKKVIHASRITSTNSLGNWIFMDAYPELPLPPVSKLAAAATRQRPIVTDEIYFKDEIIYNQYYSQG